MRVVIQRVSEASVRINAHIKSSIQKGLLIFISIEEADNSEDITWLSGKITRLRVFDDEEGKMNLSLQEVKGEIMVISQFTLHASTKKGNRPSYIKAAAPETAIPIYQKFIKQLELDLSQVVKTGEFGAYMKISITNDGPVTILIDTKNKE